MRSRRSSPRAQQARPKQRASRAPRSSDRAARPRRRPHRAPPRASRASSRARRARCASRPARWIVMEMKHRRLLDGLSHFADFQPAELDALAGVLKPRTLTANARLFRHGDAADGCYIVAEGRVRVALGKDGEGEQLAVLGG